MNDHEPVTAVAYLRELLRTRSAANKSYSLRTFALEIGLSPSYLSQVLNGKRKLLADTALKISSQLGVGPEEAEYFRLLAHHDALAPSLAKTEAWDRIRAHKDRQAGVQDDADKLHLIKDWYHLALLEMTFLADFALDAKAAALRLGISEQSATAAIERLERLGLLAQDLDGTYRKKDRNLTFRMADRHEAFAHFHDQMLGLSQAALRRNEMATQFFTSQTFSIDKAKLPAAKVLVREFLEKMAAFFDGEMPKTDTYHLSVQLFNLTDGAPKVN